MIKYGKLQKKKKIGDYMRDHQIFYDYIMHVLVLSFIMQRIILCSQDWKYTRSNFIHICYYERLLVSFMLLK